MSFSKSVLLAAVSLVSLGISAGASGARAAEPESSGISQADIAYYTIGKVSVTEVPESESTGALDPALSGPASLTPLSIGAGAIDIGEIVNIAKEIWKVIQENKPVVNVKMDHADALPRGVDSWTRLGYWKPPVSKVYRITYENLYGMAVVDFSFRVIFNYGGRLNGKGRYIANATIVPANLDVAWGYTFNAQAGASAVLNAGSPTDPLAAIQLDLHWSVDTVLKHNERTENFYLRGDGWVEKLQ